MQEPDLYFKPWQGDDYAACPYDLSAIGRSGVYPMHVLGESHYSDEERRPSFTIEVIENLAWSPARSPFFRNTLKAVSGRDVLDFQEMRKAWRNLAFSNYVQDFLPGPRIPPTSEMWTRGHLAFAELLPRYAPTALLVAGQRLWRTMNKANSFALGPIDRDGVVLDDARIYEWISPTSGKLRWTLAVHIVHPSAPKFELRKAQTRVTLMRQWMDNIDLEGAYLTFEEQRRKIAA